jgi:hypothetical protein
MPDYENGKIYTVRCLTDKSLIYVGSTTQPLHKRMNEHRSRKTATLGLVMYDKGIENFYIELYELFPCNSRQELEKREGEVIREIGTINLFVAGRTHQEYFIEKKEQISAKRKIYKEKNKDLILQKQRESYQNNKEKILQQQKLYHDKNKDEINAKKREFRANNKEYFNQQKKEWVDKNRERVNEVQREWRRKNKDECNEKHKIWRQNNLEEQKQKKRDYYNKNKEIINQRRKELYKLKKEQKQKEE